MLSIVTQNAVMPSVVMLTVVTPNKRLFKRQTSPVVDVGMKIIEVESKRVQFFGSESKWKHDPEAEPLKSLRKIKETRPRME